MKKETQPKEEKRLEKWELELKELCNFTINEGFDPHRFRSFISQLLAKEKEPLF